MGQRWFVYNFFCALLLVDASIAFHVDAYALTGNSNNEIDSDLWGKGNEKSGSEGLSLGTESPPNDGDDEEDPSETVHHPPEEGFDGYKKWLNILIFDKKYNLTETDTGPENETKLILINAEDHLKILQNNDEEDEDNGQLQEEGERSISQLLKPNNFLSHLLSERPSGDLERTKREAEDGTEQKKRCRCRRRRRRTGMRRGRRRRRRRRRRRNGQQGQQGGRRRRRRGRRRGAGRRRGGRRRCVCRGKGANGGKSDGEGGESEGGSGGEGGEGTEGLDESSTEGGGEGDEGGEGAGDEEGGEEGEGGESSEEGEEGGSEEEGDEEEGEEDEGSDEESEEGSDEESEEEEGNNWGGGGSEVSGLTSGVYPMPPGGPVPGAQGAMVPVPAYVMTYPNMPAGGVPGGGMPQGMVPTYQMPSHQKK